MAKKSFEERIEALRKDHKAGKRKVSKRVKLTRADIEKRRKPKTASVVSPLKPA